MRAPMPPDVLACTLGLTVREVPGARMTFRLGPATGGGVITVDPTLEQTERDAFIARGCASYLLRRSGAIKSRSLNVGDVAAALCHVDGKPVALFTACV